MNLQRKIVLSVTVLVFFALVLGMFGVFDGSKPAGEAKAEPAMSNMGFQSLPDNIHALPPLKIDVVSVSTPGALNHQGLLERLQYLVQNNIDPNVASELDYLMRMHRVIYVMDPNCHELASFYTTNGQPHMKLNSRRLAQLGDRMQVAGFMIVIAHEFVHYKQWLGARDDFEKNSFEYAENVPLPPELCKLLFFNERDAYRRQCELGNRYGMHWRVEGTADYCAHMQPPSEFDKAFLQAQLDTASQSSACAQTWKTLVL